MATIVLYDQLGCRPSLRAMDFFRARGIAFTARDVTADEDAAAALAALGVNATPKIVIDGVVRVGFSPRGFEGRDDGEAGVVAPSPRRR